MWVVVLNQFRWWLLGLCQHLRFVLCWCRRPMPHFCSPCVRSLSPCPDSQKVAIHPIYFGVDCSSWVYAFKRQICRQGKVSLLTVTVRNWKSTLPLLLQLDWNECFQDLHKVLQAPILKTDMEKHQLHHDVGLLLLMQSWKTSMQGRKSFIGFVYSSVSSWLRGNNEIPSSWWGCPLSFEDLNCSVSLAIVFWLAT